MEIAKKDQVVIDRMITRGDSFDKIVKVLDNRYHWTDIQAYCYRTGKWSWQGSKAVISARLKWLNHLTEKEQHRTWISEIQERVNYLYYSARAMKTKLDQIEKALG